MEDVLPRSSSSPCSVDGITMLCGLTGLIGGEVVPTELEGAYEKNLARGGLEVLCATKRCGSVSQKPACVQHLCAVRQRVGTCL